MSSLIDFLGELWEWLKEYLLWLPLKVWELLTDGLATMIEAIPVPAFLQNANLAISDIPPEVMYFAETFLIEEGISMCIAALMLRFMIRRIPLIG